jgi:hypothetical protein
MKKTTFVAVGTVVLATSIGLGSASVGAAPRRPKPGPVTTTTTVAPKAPAAPTNLRLTGTPSSTSFSVIVDPFNGAGVSGYRFYLNGVRSGRTCSGSSYCFGDESLSGTYQGLTPGTTYTATATAYLFTLPGGQILESAPSAPFVFTTPAS